MKAVRSFRMLEAGYKVMLFQIPELYCISLFLSNRSVTKPVPPTSEMAEMSLQEHPPVCKTGTSGKQ